MLRRLSSYMSVACLMSSSSGSARWIFPLHKLPRILLSLVHSLLDQSLDCPPLMPCWTLLDWMVLLIGSSLRNLLVSISLRTMLISNNDGLFVMSFYWMGSRGRSTPPIFLPHTKKQTPPKAICKKRSRRLL